MLSGRVAFVCRQLSRTLLWPFPTYCMYNSVSPTTRFLRRIPIFNFLFASNSRYFEQQVEKTANVPYVCGNKSENVRFIYSLAPVVRTAVV